LIFIALSFECAAEGHCAVRLSRVMVGAAPSPVKVPPLHRLDDVVGYGLGKRSDPGIM
jgi:hypothetical protein